MFLRVLIIIKYFYLGKNVSGTPLIGGDGGVAFDESSYYTQYGAITAIRLWLYPDGNCINGYQ